MKYGIGDIVMVRPDLKYGERYTMEGPGRVDDVVTADMEELAGKRIVITDIYGEKYRARTRECERNWTDGMFCDPEYQESDVPIDQLLFGITGKRGEEGK